jgi:hypothetical protein
MRTSLFSNDSKQGQIFPYYFPDLHGANESIDPPTRPTIFVKASALDESNLSDHLGTKALGEHSKAGAHLSGDAFNNSLR